MNLRKTITAATFFLALFISQAGYYFIYTIQQHYLRQIAEEKIVACIPDELLTAIDASADAKEIQWKEEGKEFYMRGQLYDVAKKKNLDGKTVIFCFNDRDEGKLLREFTRSGNENTGKNNKQLTKFQFADLMIAAKKISHCYRDQSLYYSSFNDNILPGTIEVKSPPPKA